MWKNTVARGCLILLIGLGHLAVGAGQIRASYDRVVCRTPEGGAASCCKVCYIPCDGCPPAAPVDVESEE